MSLWDEHLGGIVEEGDAVYHDPGSPECVRRVKQITEVLPVCRHLQLADVI